MSGLGLTFLRRGGQAHPTAGSDYIKFADAEVERILMSKGVSSDGVGITKEDAAAVTSIQGWFAQNANIVTFNELQYFTGLSMIGNPSSNNSPYGFYQCTNLREVTLPKTDIILAYQAFRGCDNLTTIHGMENVTELRTNSFRDCPNLYFEDLNMPKLEVFQESVFYGGARVRHLNLGKVTKLPTASASSVHYGAKDTLESIRIDHALAIPSYSFANYVALSGVIDLRDTDIESLEGSCFNNCSSITDIYLPRNLKKISGAPYRYAIYKYSQDGVINLPLLETISGACFQGSAIVRVESLGACSVLGATSGYNYTFTSCQDLVFFRVPPTTTQIGSRFVTDCPNLTSIVVEAISPPSIVSDSFSNVNNATFYVPDASVNAYKEDATWSKFASRIKGISEYNV